MMPSSMMADGGVRIAAIVRRRQHATGRRHRGIDDVTIDRRRTTSSTLVERCLHRDLAGNWRRQCATGDLSMTWVGRIVLGNCRLRLKRVDFDYFNDYYYQDQFPVRTLIELNATACNADTSLSNTSRERTVLLLRGRHARTPSLKQDADSQNVDARELPDGIRPTTRLN